MNRLSSSGYQAYLVGGSVRDLLLGKVPKDFDVATNATPTQIRGLFRNGRVIGRRFKLVHVIFYRDIIEVATFRGHEGTTDIQLTNERGMLIRDNVYGTLEQDAWRRDFTVNSLYYDISDGSIVDLTNGMPDITSKHIRMIGDPEKRYLEDPVRMLRAIRFCSKLHFELAPETAEPIRRLSHLIRHVPSSRLFDELTKLYQCGESAIVQKMLVEYGLFAELFTQTYDLYQSSYPVNSLLMIALENTDRRVHDNKPITPAFLFAILLWFPLLNKASVLQKEHSVPPLPALDQAMSLVVAEQNQVIAIPKRFSQVMREIWLLQFKFSKRSGDRALQLLQHPRFRAAYDFLALRALAGDESMQLADWWTTFQEVDEHEQARMISAVTEETIKKRKRKKKPKPAP